MSKNPVFCVGCSGWDYEEWRGRFYPLASERKEWLKEYATVFSSVEISSTFYLFPEKSAVSAWLAQVPADFVFSARASSFITYMKKLNRPGPMLERFLSRMRVLGNNLGPILFQLPPRWTANPARLELFVGLLPKDLEYVFEFRDRSWYNDAVYKVLSKNKMSLGIHDMKGSETPPVSIGPLCYIRFHGTEGVSEGRYDDALLGKWAKFITDALAEGKKVYAYFNNDRDANAPHDAVRLRKMVERRMAKGAHMA